MPNHYITFNGITSTSVGVKAVERYPQLNRPRRKFSKQEVPGRTGDIIAMQDAWEDYEQQYEIYAGTGASGNAPTAYNDIMQWLHGANGYARLEDTYDTTVYRMAYFAGPTDVENILNRFGRATITFVCKGKRWLKSGETETTVSTSGTTISNPTAFASMPLLKLHGTSGTATVTVGGTTITLPAMEEGLVIDCEAMTVVDNNGDPSNGSMALGSFPTITSGSSTVSWTGTITSVGVTPRWFII